MQRNPLCSSLPSLYDVASSKGAKVANYGKSRGQDEGGTSDSRDTLMIGS